MNSADDPDPIQKYSVQEERAKFGEEKPKAKDTARLIWASKPRKEPNPKELEFQTAEEVYPNVADVRDQKLSAYTTNGRKIADQPNRLIWGDNLLVMQALLAQGYEGQIDLIYIDPPFNTGENFNFDTEVKIGNSTYEKELPICERLAYTDTWSRGLDSFLDMIYPRLQLMQRLLSDRGSIYVHCDWRVNSYIRLLLEELFGKENFRNQIIWKRTGARSGTVGFNIIDDSILFFSKSDRLTWNTQYIPYSQEYLEDFFRYRDSSDRRYRHTILTAPGKRSGSSGEPWRGYNPTIKGRHWAFPKYMRMNLKNPETETVQEALDELDAMARVHWPEKEGGVPSFIQFEDEMDGVELQSIWSDISPIGAQASERINYPTQKPKALLERIIKASSNEGDLIADFFCGSGTTGAAAEELGRRWILSDISKTAIQVTRSRFVKQNSHPFVIENLGNYQRQLIYAKEVNLKQMYAIILKLYGAVPHPDMQGFGTSREDKSTLVYVCQPDRAMTAKKALDLARMARAADGKGYRNLVILAWDYDYDFDVVYKKFEVAYKKISKGREKELSDVEFKIIPSDVYKYLRSTKLGDPELSKKITFYQKPYIR
ncbi:MAG: site-specific DNA-methyltransferase, partial [Methanomicrobiales archaeon]|nr:site-specific DNA-methyltransferase [Methanomicrobiales archaeon]